MTSLSSLLMASLFLTLWYFPPNLTNNNISPGVVVWWAVMTCAAPSILTFPWQLSLKHNWYNTTWSLIFGYKSTCTASEFVSIVKIGNFFLTFVTYLQKILNKMSKLVFTRKIIDTVGNLWMKFFVISMCMGKQRIFTPHQMPVQS